MIVTLFLFIKIHLIYVIYIYEFGYFYLYFKYIKDIILLFTNHMSFIYVSLLESAITLDYLSYSFYSSKISYFFLGFY
jgi:hypothetical protein